MNYGRLWDVSWSPHSPDSPMSSQTVPFRLSHSFALLKNIGSNKADVRGTFCRFPDSTSAWHDLCLWPPLGGPGSVNQPLCAPQARTTKTDSTEIAATRIIRIINFLWLSSSRSHQIVSALRSNNLIGATKTHSSWTV